MTIYHGSTMPVEAPQIINSGRIISKPYDIVFGAVANDKVYRVIQFYENGVYDKDEAIKRLKADKLLDQILFHTKW